MKRKILDIFKSLPTLETERLFLREIKTSDLHDVHEYRKNPEVSRYLLWKPEENVNYTECYLEYIQTLYKKGKFYDFGIYLKESGKMIGTVGFTTINLKSNSASVGYVLNSSYWGLGIAEEALRKLIDFGFNTLNFERLDARIAEYNERSKKLALKCGFKFFEIERERKLFKDGWQNVLLYSLKNPNYCHKKAPITV